MDLFQSTTNKNYLSFTKLDFVKFVSMLLHASFSFNYNLENIGEFVV